MLTTPMSTTWSAPFRHPVGARDNNSVLGLDEFFQNTAPLAHDDLHPRNISIGEGLMCAHISGQTRCRSEAFERHCATRDSHTTAKGLETRTSHEQPRPRQKACGVLAPTRKNTVRRARWFANAPPNLRNIQVLARTWAFPGAGPRRSKSFMWGMFPRDVRTTGTEFELLLAVWVVRTSRDEHEESFGKGDVLVCRVRFRQFRTPAGVRNSLWGRHCFCGSLASRATAGA